MSKHYDVVVIGAGLGALATAALLSRRSWRVLVVGHDRTAPSYRFDSMRLARRAFPFVSYTSPAWTRVAVELAQSQTFKRKVTMLDPMFQLIADGVRLSVPPDPSSFGREIERELPGARRMIDDLYTALSRFNGAADAVFETDMVLPPSGFWERRAAERAFTAAGLTVDAPLPDPIAAFPPDHLYRALVLASVRFSSALASPIPQFAVARLHGAWSRGVGHLSNGEDDIVDFLVSRIVAHGSDVRLGDRVEAVLLKRGRVSAVKLDGEEVAFGAQFIASDLAPDALSALAGDGRMPRVLSTPRTDLGDHRFVMSIVVRDAALTAPLASQLFILPEGERSADAMLHVEMQSAGVEGHTLLVVERQMSESCALPLASAREQILAAMQRAVPFLERHYVLVDSPHDGRPLWDYRSGSRIDRDRSPLRAFGISLHPEPMDTPVRAFSSAPSFGGVASGTLRHPIAGAFSVGPHVLAALGQEGELIAAWSAARIITRTDRRRERMRREMWSRVEFR